MFFEIMMKKIAIPTRENIVDDHFGHCAYYTIVTLDDENQVQNSERLDSPEGCGCKSNMQVKHCLSHAGDGNHSDACW